MKANERLIRVVFGPVVYALVIHRGKVTHTSLGTGASCTLGWTEKKALAHFRSIGARVEVI